jgi:serine acetyltransferase
MSGITVGKGSIVGAGSVVTKNVEPYSIVAGNPAKIIRYRFEDDIISKLLKLDWTSWTSDTISKHASLFNNVNEFVNIDVDTK